VAQRLRRDQLIVRRGGERGDIARARLIERAGRGGGARPDIGVERRALLDARRGGAGRKGEGAG
jgi:hypothetical protein